MRIATSTDGVRLAVYEHGPADAPTTGSRSSSGGEPGSEANRRPCRRVHSYGQL